MISTEEDDADEDYNEGEHVKESGPAAHHQEPLDHESHTLEDHNTHSLLDHYPQIPPDHHPHSPPEPSPCTPLTAPLAHESPPPLPSAGHDATQLAAHPSPPAVVRCSTTHHHSSNAGVCQSRSDEAVAGIRDASYSVRNSGGSDAGCDQTSPLPAAERLIRNFVHGTGLDLPAVLNSERSRPAGNWGLNSDLTSGRFSSADKSISIALDTLSSSPPCLDQHTSSPTSNPLAVDASPPLSGCDSSTSPNQRSSSQSPCSTTPSSISTAVARKPQRRQDHATRSRHEREDTSVGGTASDASGDGRGSTTNSGSAYKLPCFTSPDDVAARPPTEQPLPPPSPPPPPDTTLPLQSHDSTASCSRHAPQHTQFSSSQPRSLSEVDECGVTTSQVLHRCLETEPSERHSYTTRPVVNLRSSETAEPLNRTIHRTGFEGSKFSEMHHNSDLCFDGQERTSAVGLVGNFNPVFGDSLGNKCSPLQHCASVSENPCSRNQDTGDGCSDQLYKQSNKVCNSVNETELSFKCYASSNTSKGEHVTAIGNRGIHHRTSAADSICGQNSRNTSGILANSTVADFRNISGSELLLNCIASREAPTFEPQSSPVEKDFANSGLENCQQPVTILSSKSVCSDTNCCDVFQPNCLISSAENVLGRLSDLQPETVSPTISSCSLCTPHQHTTTSPLPSVVDGSFSQLHAESLVHSVQTGPDPMHREASREPLHLPTTCLDVHCTSSSNCCKAGYADRPETPCFDLNHDYHQGIGSILVNHENTPPPPSPPNNPDNTPVYTGEIFHANDLASHSQEELSTTEGPPASSTTAGEDDQVVLPCEGRMDSDGLLAATAGLELLHSQSSQDSGIASVPLEDCYPPPAPAALPSKTLASMALNSCSSDYIGSLECDAAPVSTPCAATPSDAIVYQPQRCSHDHLLPSTLVHKLAVEYPSGSPPGSLYTVEGRDGDTECRFEGVSSGHTCSEVESAAGSISQLISARQPASVSPLSCPSSFLTKEQAPITQGPGELAAVPTLTHQHSLRGSTEVAPDKTREAFDSVIQAHHSALKMLVPEHGPSVGDVSVLCLSEPSQILLEPGKLQDNASPISMEDRIDFSSNETSLANTVRTEVSKETDISLRSRASLPCAGATLVSDDTSDGFTSNGDTGSTNISQGNVGESSVMSLPGKNQASSLSVASQVIPTTYLRSKELSLSDTARVEDQDSNSIREASFLSKLDQFASHMAKELVQESVLLSSTHAWNIRCSGQCRREQCRQDYYQSLMLLNASLGDDPLAASHDYYIPSQAGVKMAAKDASIYSSNSSSSYGRSSSSSVGSGGWLNSLTHRGDRRDGVTAGGGGGSSGRTTSAMVLALSSGGGPGLCWTPELPYASESGGKTVGEGEEYLSPRERDTGRSTASGGNRKLFGGGEVHVESTLGKRSPYQFQKTISTNTSSTNLGVPSGRIKENIMEPELRVPPHGLSEGVSKEINHTINPRSPKDVSKSPQGCPSVCSPPSLPASLPPSRPSLSPPPSLSSTRPPGHHSRSSLSLSHESLVCKTSTAYEASLDDSHLITAAFSHDALHYGGHEDVAAASILTRTETGITKQVQETITLERQPLLGEAEDPESSRLDSDERVKAVGRSARDCDSNSDVFCPRADPSACPVGKEDCDSNSDVFCPRADPSACPVGKESSSGGQKKKRRTKSRKRSSSNRQQQRSSKSSSRSSNPLTTTTSNEDKFYRKSRKHKTVDSSDVYSVPIDSIEDPGIVHPKAVIATQPRRHSHRKHRVTSSTITAGLPLLNSSTIITNSTADVVSNSFGVGANGVNEACLSHTADLRVVIGGKASSKESKKKKFASKKQSRTAVTSSVELSSPSSRQSIVSNFGCGNNNKSSVLSSPKHKPKHPDGKQSVASDPIHMATDDHQKTCQGASDHEVHSDKVHQTYSNSSRVSRKERHEHHSRICRILPFTALKSCKRKDHSSESRDDVYVAASAQSRAAAKSSGDHRKRGHSLFSNIRNSLLSLFSFGGGGSDRSLSKEHKLRLKSSVDGIEGLRSSTSLDSDSQAIVSTSGSEVSAGGCEGPAPAGPSAAIKGSDVTAVDLLNHSNYSAFTSAINVTAARSAVGAAGPDPSEGGRERGYNNGGLDGLVLSPDEPNCHGDDTLNKETLQRVNNSEAVRAALLVPPPLPPANDPITNSNNPSVSTSSVVTTSTAPVTGVGCRSPVPVISNRALPPLPSAQPVTSVATNSSVNPSAGNASTICAASPTPPPIPPPLPQSLLSAVGPPLPPPIPATLRQGLAASIAAKASAAGAGEGRTGTSRGGGAASNDAPGEKTRVFMAHVNAAFVQESLAAGERKEDEGCHFATMIEKVKDYGWYWGPISGKAAEKIISNEPDGSFIVRDSSDDRYIFSLTFKLNGFTRHVRIEHDQGNFSFGGYTKFKSQTIVEFIESAVEHSRSGRYLFFLHRRPVLGPMRVQLLHPVSRHRHIQSLQHLCRFVIVKNVRRDLLQQLPLPVRLRDYLTSPHYYSEQVDQCMAEEEEEQERALVEAALATGAAGHEGSSHGQQDQGTVDANNIQGRQNSGSLLHNLQEVEPNQLPLDRGNGLGNSLEGQQSSSLSNSVQRSLEPLDPPSFTQPLASGCALREEPLSDGKQSNLVGVDSNSVLLGITGSYEDLTSKRASKSQISIDCESAAANSVASCSGGAKSGSSAGVESPTLECHAVLEALNCLDESITQAEASILAQVKSPSDEHSCLQSCPHPSSSCILSDDKCISAVSNPACDSQTISRVDTVVSCIIPPTTVHSSKSTCDSGATTRSPCSEATSPSSAVAAAACVSSKPPLSLSSYLHATPGKQIQKYKPGKIVSYQVDLASDSPTVIKLTKLVDQRISDEFREPTDSDTENHCVSAANKHKLDEDGNIIPNIADNHVTVPFDNKPVRNMLQSGSGSEPKEDKCIHGGGDFVDGAVIGLVDLETPFWNQNFDETTSKESSKDNRNTAIRSENVFEDSKALGHGCVDGEHDESVAPRPIATSCSKDVSEHIEEVVERTGLSDGNKNSAECGVDSSSSGVVSSRQHPRHHTAQQSFVNPSSSLPSVILNASLEELGSF